MRAQHPRPRVFTPARSMLWWRATSAPFAHGLGIAAPASSHALRPRKHSSVACFVALLRATCCSEQPLRVSATHALIVASFRFGLVARRSIFFLDAHLHEEQRPEEASRWQGASGVAKAKGKKRAASRSPSPVRAPRARAIENAPESAVANTPASSHPTPQATRPAPAEMLGLFSMVPWRIWGGQWSHSTERSRGMVTKFSGRAPPSFTITFAEASIVPIHVSWAQLLGEVAYGNGASLALCDAPPQLCQQLVPLWVQGNRIDYQKINIFVRSRPHIDSKREWSEHRKAPTRRNLTCIFSVQRGCPRLKCFALP